MKTLPFNFRAGHKLLIVVDLLFKLASAQQPRGPQQMIIDQNAENTDPITGFQNPFHKQRIDTDAIVIQRRNTIVCTYHLIDDPNGHPIFTRPMKDRGKKFIFFNNPSFPQGSGHYIVLRKMEGQNKKVGIDTPPAEVRMNPNANPVNTLPQFMYETFTLSFKDGLAGTVTDLDPFQYRIIKRRTGIGAKIRPNIRKLLKAGGGRKPGQKRGPKGSAGRRIAQQQAARGKREIRDENTGPSLFNRMTTTSKDVFNYDSVYHWDNGTKFRISRVIL